MRKNLFSFLLGVQALCLSHLMIAANDIEPTKEFYSATRMTKVFALDGKLDEWAGVPVLADPKFAIPKGAGAGGTYVLFEPYSGGTWSGPDDQTSAVQVAWDADNVYFGFVVTDDYHENSANSAWNGDSVQLMIANANRDSQVALYNYALGGVEEALGEVIVMHEAGPGGTDAIVTRNGTTKKTIYEIKLPAASLGLTAPLQAGTKFGLGMAINDGDSGAGQNGQKGWGGLGAHSIVFGKTPAQTALVTLSTNTPGTDRIFFSAINPGLSGFSFRATDKGTSIVNTNSAKLTIDGQVVTLTAIKTADATDFKYTRATPFPAGSDHTYSIEVKDTLGNTVSDSGTFKTANYAFLSAANKVTADTTKPGFIWNVHQLDAGGTSANSNSRTEQQLAGLLGNNVADKNAIGAATGAGVGPTPATAPIQFVVTGVINFSQTEGDANGNVTPDLQMPGIPGTTGSTDDIAAEVLTVVSFPAPGIYTLIVNSDDGFRTTFGKNPRDAFSTVAGEFNAGRGAADTAFDIYVESAGAYAMRTIWEEGGGGANIEILSLVGTDKVLLNDSTTNPQALKTYQLAANTLPAYVRSVSPGVGAATITRPKTIEAVLVDGATTVTASSITLKLNGTSVAVTANKTGSETKVVHTVPGELLASTVYTAELVYSDGTLHTNTWKFTTGALASTLFVIEAEDFDYDGGKTNPKRGTAGQDVNVMPYLGGAYDTLSAIEHIDFVNADGPDSDLYRTELGDDGDHEVDITPNNGAAPGNGLGGTIPIGGSDRGTFTTTSNFRIGWVGNGEWQNYTRNFPTNGVGGWWKVYAALSYDGTADGQTAGSLDRVTGGWGTVDQTVERLGSFSGPGSGGWGVNHLVAMKTATGTDAIVKLSGTNTVRFNLSSGDFDFLIFSATAPPPPYVSSGPGGGIDSTKRDAVVLDWVLNDTDTKVATNSIKVFIEEQDMTAKAVIAKTATGATIHLDLSGTTWASGERPWRLAFSDNSTPAQNVTATGIFLVNPYPTPGVFVIEAEDFNYADTPTTGGGKTNPKKGTAGQDVNVMPYDGGAYDQLTAVEGVDYNNNDGEDSLAYRTEEDATGGNEVDITASNGSRYSNDRGVFNLANNYRIGWVEDGSWQNYTRTFPTNSYNVWAALSYDGRGAGQLRGSLDLVTSDATKPNQNTDRLGTFSFNGSGGWGRNELVPMKGTNGAMATVTMGGVQTVRFNLGSGDFDYLLFVPAVVTPAAPKFTSIKRNANGSLTLEWTGGGVLEAAGAVTGPWAPITGATSPYTFTPTAAQKVLFGRIRL